MDKLNKDKWLESVKQRVDAVLNKPFTVQSPITLPAGYQVWAPNLPAMQTSDFPKYSLGQRVKTIAGGVGTVNKIYDPSGPGGTYDYIIVNDGSGKMEMWQEKSLCSESDIFYAPPQAGQYVTPPCECGAAKVGFSEPGSMHSSWCVRFIKDVR
jgi:hypothetical protein